VFSFVYSDSAGAADLASASASISPGNPGCIVTYSPAQNIFSLFTNVTTLVGSMPLGSGYLQNNVCILLGGLSSVSAAGNNLTVNLAVALKPTLSSFYTIQGEAISSTGSSSGWPMLGYFLYNTPNDSPQAVSVQPSSGSSWGSTFKFVYQDVDGAFNFTSVQAMVNASQNSASSCYLSVDPIGGTVSLANDSGNGWLGPLAFGTQASLQNSQCSVNAGASGGALGINSYSVNLALTFFQGFAGAKNIYGYASGLAGRISGWQMLGAWAVGPPSPCDLSGNGVFDASDVQGVVNQALGVAGPGADLNGDRVVNAVDVQIVTNAVMGGSCSDRLEP
jgi:hypothetical protein